VNYELAGLIYDMYKLHQKLNIELEWTEFIIYDINAYFVRSGVQKNLLITL
jgi:hypothetical protein